MTRKLSGAASIVGIGATVFSKDSGRSELRLAAEAVTAAVADAGLTPADVDGLVSFTMDTNTEIAVARATGIGELTYFSRIHYGGGAACSTVQQAAMAVATGVADVVVAYRAFNGRSGMRFGQVNQDSRWIAEPLHLLDCCQESDGGVALVITSAERARDLPNTPVAIAGAASGSGQDQYIMTSYYRDDLAGLPEMGLVGRQLWEQSGLGPDDVDVAVLYDHFTPYTLMQLEELGFCGRG